MKPGWEENMPTKRRRWFGWLFFAFLAGLTVVSHRVVQPFVTPAPEHVFSVPGLNLRFPCFSPDGSVMAAMAWVQANGKPDAGNVYVWNVPSGSLRSKLRIERMDRGITLTPTMSR